MPQQMVTFNNSLLIYAPAKINLILLIEGKRPDGFHNLKTIMAKLNWYDELRFSSAANEGIELHCTGQYWAPEGRENLVYRAIEMLCEHAQVKAKVKVELTKNIPAGSGLGSASSDAAAALIGANEYLKLGASQDAIESIAAKLGSDVVFFLGGPLAFCSGRGEKIQKIPEKFAFEALLILPGVNTSTKRVYENYHHDVTLFEQLNSKFEAFLAQKRVDLVTKMCANMLEDSCFLLHPDIAELKTRIEQLGITPLCLSGSGSTLYHLSSENRMEELKRYQCMLNQQVSCRSIIVCGNEW